MNKSQLKQFTMIQAQALTGNLGAAARGLSAMYRAAMSNKSRDAIITAAIDLKVTNQPDFII